MCVCMCTVKQTSCSLCKWLMNKIIQRRCGEDNVGPLNTHRFYCFFFFLFYPNQWNWFYYEHNKWLKPCFKIMIYLNHFFLAWKSHSWNRELNHLFVLAGLYCKNCSRAFDFYNLLLTFTCFNHWYKAKYIDPSFLYAPFWNCNTI